MPTLKSTKNFVKQFVPPIVVSGAKALRDINRKPYLEYAPDGWNTRLPETKNRGWSVDSVINSERQKWDLFCRNAEGTGPLGFSHEAPDLTVVRNRNAHNVHVSFAFVLALAAHKREHISVLDYGGALGHYYVIAKAMLPHINIDYHVKEVPLMVEAGRQLNPAVTWYDDDSFLGRTYDVIMMNGSTPYLPDWKEQLSRIAKSVDQFFFLTRQAVVQESPSYVAIQRVYNSHMLHQQLNQSELLQVVGSTGLKLVREFVVADTPRVENAPEQPELRGWLFKKE